MKKRISLFLALLLFAPHFASAAFIGTQANNAQTTTFSTDAMYLSSSTPTFSGTLTAGACRQFASTTGSYANKIVVYAGTSTSPTTYLAESNATTTNWSGERNTPLDFAGLNQIRLTAGTIYWFGAFAQDPGATNVTLSRANTTNTVRSMNTSYPINPSTFVQTATSSGPIDCYLLYTPDSIIDIRQSSSTYAATTTTPHPVLRGSLLVGSISTTNSGTAETCSDSMGNTYTTAARITNSNGTAMTNCYAIATSSGIVSLFIGGTSGDKGGAIMEITGYDPTNIVNATATRSITTTTNNPTTTITTTRTTLIMAGFAEEQTGGTVTAGAGYTLIGQNSTHHDSQEYMITAATTSRLVNLSTAQSVSRWVINVLAINQANFPQTTPKLQVQGGVLNVQGGTLNITTQ